MELRKVRYKKGRGVRPGSLGPHLETFYGRQIRLNDLIVGLVLILRHGRLPSQPEMERFKRMQARGINRASEPFLDCPTCQDRDRKALKDQRVRTVPIEVL